MDAETTPHPPPEDREAATTARRPTSGAEPPTPADDETSPRPELPDKALPEERAAAAVRQQTSAGPPSSVDGGVEGHLRRTAALLASLWPAHDALGAGENGSRADPGTGAEAATETRRLSPHDKPEKIDGRGVAHPDGVPGDEEGADSDASTDEWHWRRGRRGRRTAVRGQRRRWRPHTAAGAGQGGGPPPAFDQLLASADQMLDALDGGCCGPCGDPAAPGTGAAAATDAATGAATSGADDGLVVGE